jgi:hypothetical protein
MYIRPDLDSQLIRQSSEDVLGGSGSARTSRLGRIAAQIKQTWTDFNYAQRRLLEIQLGAPTIGNAESESRAAIAALEAVYSRPSHR